MFKITNNSNVQQPDNKMLGVSSVYNGQEIKSTSINNDTFLAITVHDLKTPVSAQIHALEFLLTNSVPDTIRQEILTDILGSAKYMKTLVGNILSKYKCENKRLTLYKTKASLEKLTAQCIEELKYLFCGKNIKVKINSSIKNIETEFDVTEIKRVIHNLLINAITYGAADTEILINLNTSNNTVVFSIVNQGLGINPEDFDKIFEEFESFSLYGKSTGLGLYISKLITEAHGGKIFAESKNNEFTKITFTLPCKQQI